MTPPSSQALIQSPVVFLFFNRPDTTRQVFAEIARGQPAQLFLIADGPRPTHPDDGPRCRECREIVQAITWPCEVHTNFSDRNLGCGLRVATGLDWVFSKVDRAIILEDDCVPAPEFFRFCDTLLDRYAEDTRVGAICGSNFVSRFVQVDWSYFFSRYAHLWGWATWRRVWRQYDYSLAGLPQVINGQHLADIFPRRPVLEFWQSCMVNTYAKRVDTWDYQFAYTLFMNSMLSITPGQNLISNIGCARADATHTVLDSPFANLPLGGVSFPLKPPPFVSALARIDAIEERFAFGIKE